VVWVDIIVGLGTDQRPILLKGKMDSRFPPTPSSFAKATEDRGLRRTGRGNDAVGGSICNYTCMAWPLKLFILYGKTRQFAAEIRNHGGFHGARPIIKLYDLRYIKHNKTHII